MPSIALQVFELVIVVCLFQIGVAINNTPQDFKIGILNFRGAEVAYNQWNATAKYIQDHSVEFFGVQHTFSTIALTLAEIDIAVAEESVDFVITTPSQYVLLEVKFAIYRIATLVNLRQNHRLTKFGGVIFSMKESNISTLQDFEKAKIHAASPVGFGAYLMQIGYLDDMGVDTSKLNISFLFNQNKIVSNVLDGVADVGFVRTDQLERFVAANPEYEEKYKRVSIFKPVSSSTFPFPHTTELYPEWPFSLTSSVETRIDVRRMITLLFSIPSNSTAAIKGQYDRWTYPLNYISIFTLLSKFDFFDDEYETCLKKCNAGTCEEINNSTLCNCDVGWQGEFCDVISPKIETWVTFDDYGTYVVVVLCAIEILLILVLMTHMVIHRNSKRIKKTGFWFTTLSLIGYLLMLFSIFLWVGKPYDITCSLRVWLADIGFTLAFVGPVVKMVRLSILYRSELFTINDITLAKIVVVVIFFKLCFLACWQIVAPSVVSKVQVKTSFDTVDAVCKFNIFFGAIAIFVKIFFMIIFGWLTFAIHKTNIHHDLKEQKYINLSVYNSMVIIVLCSSLYLAISDKRYYQEFYIFTCGYLILTASAILPLLPTLLGYVHTTDRTVTVNEAIPPPSSRDPDETISRL